MFQSFRCHKNLLKVGVSMFLVVLLTSGSLAQSSIKEYMAKATAHYKKGEFKKALIPALKALDEAEKTESSWLSYCAFVTGNIHCELGQFDQGASCFRKSLAADEKSYGAEHAETARSLDSLASALQLLSQYEEAELLLKRYVAVIEKLRGPDHPQTAIAFNKLGNLYLETGNHKAALPLFIKSLDIRTKVLGEEHPSTVKAENNLGLLYADMGQASKALPLLERALRNTRKISPGSERVSTSLLNLASVYQDLGSFRKAESLSLESLRLAEKLYGPDHKELVNFVNNLGQLYKEMGRYKKARTMLERALEISRKGFGLKHSKTSACLTNLGALKKEMSDYRGAFEHYRDALRITEETLGPENFRTAKGYNNLGALYKELGDFKRAKPLLAKSLQITERALGPNNPATARALNNLAAVEEHSKAGPLYKRALKIRREVQGAAHIETAMALNNLGSWYLLNGDLEQAEKLLQESLAIRRRLLGKHVKVADSLGLLARVFRKSGELDKAKNAYSRCLDLSETLLGSSSPETIQYTQALATTEFLQGNLEEALVQEVRALSSLEKILPNVLAFTSEQQRLSFQRSRPPFDLLATLADAPAVRSKAAPQIAQTILRHKGLTLDSLLEDMRLARQSDDPNHRALVEELKAARDLSAKLALEGKPDSEASERVEELEREIAGAGADLGRPRRALLVTLRQVQEALPEDAVLIEFLRFRKRLSETENVFAYGAAVISSEKIAWVPLGPAEAIESELKAYRKAARRYSERSTTRTTRALYDTVWKPLLSEIPKTTKTVVLSPDGQLNFLSFATLLSPNDRLLAQDYLVTYVTSGRDLLREFKSRASVKNAVILGNPNFDAKGKGESTFAPLPGTSVECTALQRMLAQAGLDVQLKMEETATEESLQMLDSPGILHLATHGFFLSNDVFQQSGTRAFRPLVQKANSKPVVSISPMERSGLAFSGANSSISDWTGGAARSGLDGLLTAQEAGALSLERTWLVTLSACETGVGEARPGEGVMGLRRGFSQAGARHVLMTLWPVADEETAAFMAEFYEAALAENPTRAMAETQRKWLTRLRKEQGLAAAVNLAGPFVLTFQGKL